MSKTILPYDVDTAADRRLDLVFAQFERVCVSLSAGKDSTVLFWKAYQRAQALHRTLDVLFLDLEAQYETTIDLMHTCMRLPGITPWWVCLPLNLRNAVSVFAPHWCCWEPGQEQHWVRPLPDAPGVITDRARLPFYTYRMEFETFVEAFSPWLQQHYGGASVAQLVAIRSNESLNRWRAVKPQSDKKSAYRLDGTRYRWSTVHTSDQSVVSFYPLYDWEFGDIWTYIGRHQVPYNAIYDRMYRHGVPFKNMRICQPYGDDQRKGLDMWQALEPASWERVVARVVGANGGAKYARGKLLGYQRGLGVPDGHTWKSYTFFLLATLPDVLRERHLANYAVFLEWWSRNGFPDLDQLPDDGDPVDYARYRIPTWRRLALAVLKNDFNGHSLSIGAIKNVQSDVYDRVAAGEPIKVRKAVAPWYAMLRAAYAQSIQGREPSLALPTVTPRGQAIKAKYRDL